MGTIINRKHTVFIVLLVLACTLTCYSCNTEPKPDESGTVSESGESSEVSYPAYLFDQSQLGAHLVESDSSAPEGFKSASIDFKDHRDLHLDLAIPSNWELVTENRKEGDPFGSPVSIYVDGKKIGYIGNAAFEQELLDRSELGSRAPYHELMMSPHVNWDSDYKEISSTSTTNTAICTAFHSNKMVSGKEAEYNMGILSYDTQLLRYVGIEIEAGSITEEQRLTIAESIRLSALEE